MIENEELSDSHRNAKLWRKSTLFEPFVESIDVDSDCIASSREPNTDTDTDGKERPVAHSADKMQTCKRILERKGIQR